MPAFLKNVHVVAQENPDQKAIIAAGISVNYITLSTSINAVARSLRSKGVESGDRVAMLAHKTIESVVMILGALQAGAAIVPINPMLKKRQIDYIISHCTPSVLLCPARSYIDLRENITATPSLKTVVLAPASNANDRDNCDAITLSAPHAVAPITWADFLTLCHDEIGFKCSYSPTNDIAAILYTSGSTGTPKGVVLTRSNLHHGALCVSTYLENTADDRILGLMPLSFDYGLSQLTTAMHSGACLVLHDYYFPKGVIEAVLKYRITGLPAVPHLWDQLLAIEWPETTHLRYVTSTGGSLLKALCSPDQTCTMVLCVSVHIWRPQLKIGNLDSCH